MTKQVQIRRGTDSQHTSFTGAEGEISVNTTNDSVHVHDGTTAGGKEMARADGSNVAFTGGTIDGATIGGTTPAAGTFTTLTASGDVNFDSNTLFVDASANAVGVGTSSPSGAFTSAGGRSFFFSGDLYGIGIAQSSGQANYAYLGSDASGNLQVSDTQGNQIATFTQDNNVGIGTSSPSQKLTVQSGTSSSPAVNLLGAGASQGWLRLGNNADIKGGDDYLGMTFTVGASERMRIDSSGQVGIGTSSPNAKLTVNTGNRSTDGKGGTLCIGGDADTAGGLTNNTRKFGFITVPHYENAEGNLWLVGADAGASSNDIYIGGAFTGYNAATSIRFNTAANSTTSVGTERMRIDSSGNTTLAKSSTNTLGTVGHDFGVTGYAMHTRASSNVLYLNRTTSDGNIAEFYKDGSSVGSIYTNAADGGSSSELCIASGNTGLKFDDTNNYIRPTNSAGAHRDNTVSLGTANSRFKNFHLNGGIYFGSRSNALDDYEEGTFSLTTVTSGYTGSGSGNYTKIGNTVNVWVKVEFSAVSSSSNSSVQLSGLPFNSSNNAPDHYVGVVREATTSGDIFVSQINKNDNKISFNSMDGVSNNSNQPILANKVYLIQATYRAG